MGEQKRREAQQTPYERMLTELSRRLSDEGRLIEAGWIGLRKMVLPPETTPEQVDDMRKAFMGGAQHLFSSIMTFMDEDHEPTPADMRRMDLIHRELEAFAQELAMDLPVSGTA